MDEELLGCSSLLPVRCQWRWCHGPRGIRQLHRDDVWGRTANKRQGRQNDEKLRPRWQRYRDSRVYGCISDFRKEEFDQDCEQEWQKVGLDGLNSTETSRELFSRFYATF